MTNHIHLLLTPATAEACAALMKSVGQEYAQYINRVRGRTGSLWEGRFRSSVAARDEYVLACYRYIELNPVRAGLSLSPGEYQWSSFRCNAEGQADSLLASHPVYATLEDDDEARRRVYRGLFDIPMGTELLNEIRSASRTGRALGSERRSRGRPAQTQNRDRPLISHIEK